MLHFQVVRGMSAPSFALALLGIAAPAAAQFDSFFINEIRLADSAVDEAGTESPMDLHEYVEIRGPGGSTLSGLTYIVIGGRTDDPSGVITFVADLTTTDPMSMPGQGVFAVAPFGSLAPADYFLPATSGWMDERYNQTHILVRGFDPDIGVSVGSDLDLDNNGSLDGILWDELLDSVSFVGAPNGGQVYSGDLVGPWREYLDTDAAPTSIAPHAFRGRDNAAWFLGVLEYRTTSPTAPPQSTAITSPLVRDPRTRDTCGTLNDTCDCKCAEATVDDPIVCWSCAGDVNYNGNVDGRVSATNPFSVSCTVATADSCLARKYSSDSTCRDIDRNGTVNAADQAIITAALQGASTSACVAPGSPPACTGSLQNCMTPSTAGLPGCRWPACCAAVCAEDPDCCNIAWDSGCSTNARQQPECLWRCDPCDAATTCGESTHSCFEVHEGPGCSSAECCSVVCASYPPCCQSDWDSACVGLAQLLVGGGPLGGNCDTCDRSIAVDQCIVEHPSPGCSNPACCASVCAVLNTCCTVTWDAACVQEAGDSCLDCNSPLAGSAYIPHSTPYCNDPSGQCCDRICFHDLDPTTAEVEALRPECCTIQWDDTCVAYARQYCVSCGDSWAGTCNTPHLSPNCKDAECCDTVCGADPSCCEVNWDSRCVELAQWLCLDCGSPYAGDCCVPHLSPYCRETSPGEGGACCTVVCGYDPPCCDLEWDQFCVALARLLCDLTCGCGDSDKPCEFAHDGAGCEQVSCCTSVCTVDPYCCEVEWDNICVQQALVSCSFEQANCGVGGSGPCQVANNGPGCTDAACCESVCKVMPECCVVVWDEECANLAVVQCNHCGDPQAGSCWAAHSLGGCEHAECCELVCATSPECCALQWDNFCAAQAIAACGDFFATLCGDDSARSCFVESPVPGCADGTCCELICASYDPFCCEERWDASCVYTATIFCDPPYNSGDRGCFTAHAGGSCYDLQCANAVCQFIPNCCGSVWDQACADLALDLCIRRDTCPAEGSCFSAHAGIGCDDPSCCNAVCGVDPSCCAMEWDSGCTDLADIWCVADSDEDCPCFGPCLEAHSNPGCEDEACCTAVCQLDVLCCTAAWDSACASLAGTVCCGSARCGDVCSGPCDQVHFGPYCEDAYCCAAVCEIDTTCCTANWDEVCVELALQRCTFCGSSANGSCWTAHLAPGCDDGDICQQVCANPEFANCCALIWDQSCVDQAALLFGMPACGDADSGRCDEVHSNPWCDDTKCCEAICLIDPFCCSSSWDDACVQAIYTNCPTFAVECGDECAGSCCKEHRNPGCDNAECCAAVCLLDPFCCATSWDATCANAANTLCIGEEDACPQPVCGDGLAGDCCSEHPHPYCQDLECCEAVCAADPFCCSSVWDGACANEAQQLCLVCEGATSCGTPLDGHDCLSPSKYPYCVSIPGVTIPDCCEVVCATPGFTYCCQLIWDETCVAAAAMFCFGPSTPPDNDDCVNAQAVFIDDDSPQVVSFSNLNGTNSLLPDGSMFPDPSGCDGAAAGVVTPLRGDVWFVVTPPCSGTIHISTCDLSATDTIIAVYQRSPDADPLLPDCAALVQFGVNSCSDDFPFCAFGASDLTLPNISAGKPLWIRVGSPWICSDTGCLSAGFLVFELDCP